MQTCSQCARPLTRDEIGLSKKLINRGTTVFFCLKCLSERFCVSEELLQEKIDDFRAQGCTLFQ